MIVIAGVAVALAMMRRDPSEKVAAALAMEICSQYEPGFEAGCYRAVSVDLARNGQTWQVRLAKVEGTGRASIEASVPEWRVREARRLFWEPRPIVPSFPTP